MVPATDFLDLQAINKGYEKAFHEVLTGVMDRGWYILGQAVMEFEKSYAQYNDTAACIGVANGLDALILSLEALGIGPGDEVIVPSNTYIASWLAVSQVGATPVPVEPRADTWNIDPVLVERAITGSTKAVMAVNLYGQAAELIKIDSICKKHNIFLIEDNAQAQGAKCAGRLAGSVGIVNGTSFYPGKNLGALGDAGAVTTNDGVIEQSIRMLRNYGSEVKYYNLVKGHNSRLDELQAAFLSIKLKGLEAENNYRVECAAIYREKLGGISEVEVPVLADQCTSVYHIYMIRTKQREPLQQFLKSKGIGTMIHYPVPPHLQAAYAELGYQKGAFPIAESIADTCLSLPMGPHLDHGQVEGVADLIKEFFTGKYI